ncbi:MAG: TldD/PmbA family protein [Chloroflexota bacterium]|nr:MAG: TldD/PmbA family protein [Chloroflexota bacterium]
MLTEREARAIVEAALAESKADQTEVTLYAGDSALTRFANNYIHQNVAESNISISVRTVFGKRIGIASLNSVTPDAIAKVVETASTIAQHQIENPDFVSLPGPKDIRQARVFFDSTAAYTPEQRARDVGLICRKAADQGLVASGAYETSSSVLCVGNSLGVFGYDPSTMVALNTVIMADAGSGYADYFTADVGEVNIEALADEACDKALRSRNPRDIEPGVYEVILEEAAVGDILDYLAYLGLSALAVQEERSFMNDKFGQRIVGQNISIWDDGLGAGTVPMPFDFEGVPKQRVDFFVNGVANAVCYDSYTAHREGRESTGHALPAGDAFGPMPLNMFLKPGDATKEQMLASTKRGIWVTRFHYTRHIHPLSVMVTGMTRDGTFWIENGEIAYPIKNLRFTQGYLEALNNVQMIGRSTKLVRELFPLNRVPALKIGAFNFTGVTEF